jgi:beta-glucosidase
MRQIVLLFVFSLLQLIVTAQPWPFQDPGLPEEERLDNLVSLLTREEKVACLSTRISVPRLGIKGTRTVEGLHGLAWSGPANWAVKGKYASPTTTFPQAIGLAQMWDPQLLREIAALEAEEARFLAQNARFGIGGLIVFAPNADLGRDIRWGRTEECFGEDPFLAATLTSAFVKGLQGDHPRYWKTASLMKHFLANSNENNRTINTSDFDERLFREYYGYAFYKGITEGGSRAFMAAYNKYNGIPCTVHPVLKKTTVNEWGQNGIIATDGGAFGLLVSAHKYYPDLTVAAAECIKAGITMFLDNYREPLNKALEAGLVTEKEIEGAIRGNLRVILRLGLLDDAPENPYTTIGIADTIAPWTKPETHDLVRRATARSVVLLKNERQFLPLDKEKISSVAVLGPRAHMVISDWYGGTPPYAVTPLEGLRQALGEGIEVTYAMSNKADSAVLLAKKADVAIVCVGNHPLGYSLGWGVNHVASDGREDVDRQAISLEQEDLVKLVLHANPNTVLVVMSSFPYAIPWSAEHVPAILHISHSSQELGNGLADVLLGRVNPAGRLAQTWPASIDHLPPMLDYNIRNNRTYMYTQHEPLFPFGHGLSYTTFQWSDLKTGSQVIHAGEMVNITFTVQNTGSRDGDEVAQLYVSFPQSAVERAPIALKGFRRISVPQGQSMEVTIPLKAEDLCYWDEERHAFTLEKGNISFFVGSSSADRRLSGTLTVL